MEVFSTLFSSPFNDPRRPIANTLAGVVNHAILFKNNLPTDGPLKVLLKAACDATQAMSLRAQALQQLLGLTVGDQKQAATHTQTALDKALTRIRKNEGTLKGDELIENDEQRHEIYDLLYPGGGVTFYTRAKLDTDTADRLDQYLTRTEQNAELLGSKFVQKVQADLGSFRQIRTDQVGAMGSTGGVRDDRHELVDEINALCDYNYFLLCLCFVNNLKRAVSFWTESYYARTTPRAQPGQVLNRAIQASRHSQLFDLVKFPTLTTLTITLRDGGPLCVALVDKATAPLPTDTLLLPLGNTPFTVLLADLPGSGSHVVVYNETSHVAHLDGQLS